MGTVIEFPSNGTVGHGYLATPEAGTGPGLVVIQEWWGLVGHITDVCDRFAGEGFVTLAPDLYHGKSASEPDEAGKLMMAMRLDKAGKDMSGAVDAVAARAARPTEAQPTEARGGQTAPDAAAGVGVGVVGFCMGGGLALMVASQRPDLVRAVVPFYGIVPWEGAQPDYGAITAAVLGHYAEHDDFASPEVVAALETTLREAGNKDVMFYSYPGTVHGFFNDDRPGQYAPDASDLAWERTIEFLHSRLG
jgi:carboxymethylenebutenolidase